MITDILFSSAPNWVNNLFQASQVPFPIILSAWCYLDSGRSGVINAGQSMQPEITKCWRMGAGSQGVGQVWGAAESQGPLSQWLSQRNPGRPTEVQVYVDTSGQMKGWTSNQEAQMVTKKVPDVWVDSHESGDPGWPEEHNEANVRAAWLRYQMPPLSSQRTLMCCFC